MPVLVTAAHRPLARRIAARLLEEGGEVRVFSSRDVTALRAAGAFVATGTSDDEGRLEAALAQVHTVVHVGGGVTSDPDVIVRDAEVLARAATGAEVRRVVTLSLPGADPAAADALRRAKGREEAVLRDIPCPTVVVRVGLVDTPVLRDALATSGLGEQLLDVEISPVRMTDVAELVTAFDRARAHSRTGHLVVAADGPRPLSIAAYLERVGVHRVGEASLVGRRLPDPVTVARLADAIRGPWRSTDPGILDGWRFADIVPEVPGVD